MIHKITLLALFLFVGTIGNAQSFDQEKLLERVKILSSDAFEGRKTGEKGSALARAFIIKTFDSLQVETFGSKYEHKFTFTSKKKEYNATNILGKIKGTEYPSKYIVVSAHYDHVGVKNGEIYNGADDDASGIAALFAFAEYLKSNPPKHTVILAAFDAEELGLRGASYFVDKMKGASIVVNLNMDMISRSSKNELYVVGASHNKTLKTIIETFDNPTEAKLKIGHNEEDDKDDWTYSSDHAAFHKEGIPFLYFGNEDHAGYHHPSDDFENITPEFYKDAVQILLSIFSEIDAKGL